MKAPAPIRRMLTAGLLAATLAACGSQERGTPSTVNTTDREVSEALARLNRFLSRRDRAIIDEFAATPDVVLLGSEAGELAIGHDQLGSFFERLFALPAQLSWDWKQTRVGSAGDVAWIFAEGEVVINADGVERRAPYRMTGVLERQDGRWRWRQFHGSEPAK